MVVRCANNGKAGARFAFEMARTMDAHDFFTASKVLIVAGKGGVGKTTVSALLGLAAARSGLNTLLVELEGKRGLGTMLDGQGELEYENRPILSVDRGDPANLSVRTIAADDALLDYLQEQGLKGFAKTLTRMQVLDTLATSTPGLKDLIVLGKIKQLEVSGDHDLIIVDAPASGHAVSFLRSASGLQQTVATGPIRRQADDVVEMLTDPDRCQVLLVAIPEETPVNELIDTAYQLEDEIGIALGTLVMNSVYPQHEGLDKKLTAKKVKDTDLRRELAAAGQFWHRRNAQQDNQLSRLTDELPLEQLQFPRLFTSDLTQAELDELANHALAEIDRLVYQ